MVTATAASQPAFDKLTVAYCPMKKAHWLQHDAKITNPYFGTEMLDCGDVQQTLMLAGDSPTAEPAIKAYLRVQKDLARR